MTITAKTNTVKPKIGKKTTHVETQPTKTVALPVKAKPKLSAAKAPEVALPTSKAVRSASKSVSMTPMPDIKFDYDGPSGCINSNKSRTVIRVDSFNTMPQAKRTVRDEKFLSGLRKHYGNQTFQRSFLDAGLLNRAIARGLIQPMSGDGVSPNDTFRLTKGAFPSQA